MSRVVTLVLVVLALAVTGCLGPVFANDVVRIGWLKAPNDLTLAKAHGSLEKALAEQGFDVSWIGPFAAASPALEALNADTIDITAGSSTSSITGLAARMPFVIFAYQKMSPGSQAILVKRGSPIRSIADLAGKSVAVNRGGTGEYLLVRALTTHHVDPATVKRVYLSPADSASAFVTDHVDAWATWDPFVSLALKSSDAHVLADGREIQSENAVVLIAAKSFAEKKRAALDTIYKTLAAENAWSIANPAAAGNIWAETMGLPADLAPSLGANNAVATHSVTPANGEEISAIADWYVAEGIIPRRPDVANGIVELKN